MITFLFGSPGSGKSYKALSIALDYIKLDRVVYSNLELKSSLDGYIYLDNYDMQNFISDLEKILSSSLSIEEYVQEIMLLDYIVKDSLLLIDECHFFGFGDRKKEFLRLFLSIHRHLNIDILLVTQTHKNIVSSHLDLGENFIKSISATNRLLKNRLEYVHFSSFDSYRLNDKMFITKRENIKSNPKIFDLYSSGAKNFGSSALRTKLLFLFSFIFLVIYFIYSSFFSLVSKPDNNSSSPGEQKTNKASLNGSSLKFKDYNITLNKKIYLSVCTEIIDNSFIPIYKNTYRNKSYIITSISPTKSKIFYDCFTR